MKGRERAWNDDERQAVAAMLQKGISMGRIGMSLGLTRNAVIGRVSRDGELHAYVARVVIPVTPPLRPVKAKQPPPSHVIIAKARRHLPLGPLGQPSAPEEPPVADPQLMQDLDHDGCRWPVEAAAVVGSFLFCGCARRDKDTRYCAYHHSIAHPETRQ